MKTLKNSKNIENRGKMYEEKPILVILTILLMFFGILVGAKIDMSEIEPVEQGSCASLLQVCDNCTYVNVTSILYPNDTVDDVELEMTKDEGLYNYTFCNTNDLGVIIYTLCGDPDGENACESVKLPITSTGKAFDEGESLASVGILFGALVCAFLFLFLSYKLSDNPQLIPLRFFFTILALVLIVYSLFLGWTLGSDVIEHPAFSETSGVIFTSFLWLIIGVAIISTALMLLSFIRELGRMADKKRFGEGWDPITHTYEY